MVSSLYLCGYICVHIYQHFHSLAYIPMLQCRWTEVYSFYLRPTIYSKIPPLNLCTRCPNSYAYNLARLLLIKCGINQINFKAIISSACGIRKYQLYGKLDHQKYFGNSGYSHLKVNDYRWYIYIYVNRSSQRGF